MAKARVIQTVLRLKDNFSKPLNDAKKTVVKFTKGTEKQQEQFAKIVKKTENSIARDLKKIKNNFKETATSVTKSLASISLKGGGFLGGTIGATSLGAGIFEGMDYETYKVQLITATKDTQKASQLMRDAISFANKTPFETGQIVEATAKFESMGLSAKKWLEITADMAGATSKDMIQAVEAVIDAVASGEFERLKEFGLSKNTLENLDTSGKVFNNQGQVIDQLALTDLLFSEMEKRYKGGAESLSKTTKGMWSTVTGVFKNSMAKIVGVTDDGMVRTGSLLDNFRKVIEKVANKMLEWQKDGTIEKISNKFDKFVGKVKEFFEDIPERLNTIKTKLKNTIKILKTMLPIIAGIIAGVKTWGIVSNITQITVDLLAKKQAILNTVAKIFNKTAWSNPWVLVIGAIVAAIVFLILHFDKVKQVATKLWGILKSGFKALGTFIRNIFLGIFMIISVILSSIVKVIISIMSGIVNLFKLGFEFVVAIIKAAIDTAITTITGIIDGVKSIFSGIIDFITGVFTGNWEKALNGLKSIAEGVFKIIKNIFLAPFRFFSKGINWVIEKINSLKINVPDWVPIIGGNTYSFNIPTIPNFATGTSYHRGGLAMINEGGRGEIVDLPNGSKIIPSDKSEKLLDKNNNNINVTVNVYNPSDVDEIIKVFSYKLKQAIDNM